MELCLLSLNRNLGGGLYCCLQLSTGRVEKMEPNSSQRGSVTEEAMGTSMRYVPAKHKEKLFYHADAETLERDPREVVESLSLEILKTQLAMDPSKLI